METDSQDVSGDTIEVEPRDLAEGQVQAEQPPLDTENQANDLAASSPGDSVDELVNTTEEKDDL